MPGTWPEICKWSLLLLFRAVRCQLSRARWGVATRPAQHAIPACISMAHSTSELTGIGKPTLIGERANRRDSKKVSWDLNRANKGRFQKYPAIANERKPVPFSLSFKNRKKTSTE